KSLSQAAAIAVGGEYVLEDLYGEQPRVSAHFAAPPKPAESSCPGASWSARPLSRSRVGNGFLPGSCACRICRLPSPQATSMLLAASTDSTVPGAPCPVPGSLAQMRNAWPPKDVQVTGHGLKARMRSCSACAGSDQSSCASSLVSLWA